MNAFAPSATWRVAALTMMTPEQLRGVLAGEDAPQWVKAATACGIAAAQLRLGRMLLEGEGVAKDARAAFACFLCAAESGDADAQNMLGRCYENGWGVETDMAKAAANYALAAEAGVAWAQYNLGHILLSGNGAQRNREAAFAWYMRVATQGHERAMNLVARCFEEGWGVVRDIAAARNWYRKSAQGGYFRGAYNYASLLSHEGCVTGAAIWFARALQTAPQPTRDNMVRMLANHPEAKIRALVNFK